MKIYKPILFDEYGNEVAWMEQEIPARQVANLRWNFGHMLNNNKTKFITPEYESDTAYEWAKKMAEKIGRKK